MVIVNPRLSLPSDLPYKKRQRPFFPNSPLQHATIRYNEAVRKKYNDNVQHAKRKENDSTVQKDRMGINTIDISKLVDPTLFLEMSKLNSFSLSKKRKSKRFEKSSCGLDSSGGEISVTNCSRQMSACVSNTATPTMGESIPIQNRKGDKNAVSYDTNDTEIFPHLQATVNAENDKTASSTTSAFFAANMKPPPSTASLEAQAINEYEPTIDSAHDMIFGNVMGMDYGNYIHGPLWTPQSCGNSTEQSHQSFHTAPPSLCCSAKLNQDGYMQTQTPLHSYSPHCITLNSDTFSENANPTGTANQLHVIGKHGGGGRRSTSVPRPRAGAQKETLKQAAIRCGIIKGNHNAASKRSYYLAPVQSDPAVSVVEIFQPKEIFHTCSSEALVDFEDFNKCQIISTNSNSTSSDNEINAVHKNKSTSAFNVNINVSGDGSNDKDRIAPTEKTTSECNKHSGAVTEIDLVSLTGILENAVSCPTL